MDRISNLQDELLCHVLSFLSVKEAALTSVLAKRWRNLFAFVPTLELDDSVFLHPEEGKRERDGVLQSFMDFADRVLALQGDSPIKKLTLNVNSGVDSDRVNRWIRNVLQRGVSDLKLFIGFGDEYRLPPEIFVSKTLVKLLVKLSVFHGFDLDWHVLGISLPMLTDLYLCSVEFCVDQFEMFLPTCPVLETLLMRHIKWNNSNVTVSSASLKKLIIESNGWSEHFVNPKSISFDTPSLVYFEYSDLVAEDYPKVNLTNLVMARIDLQLTEDQIDRGRDPNIDGLEDDGDNVFLRFGNAGKLFSGVKNVQKLYLSSDSLEVLSLCCESVPVFNNLKILHILSSENRGWQAMPVLLKNCPHLELLVFDGLLHHVTDRCGDACDCVSREDKGRSLTSSRVKMLCINGFRGTLRELKMIEHFLVSFPSLVVMQIFAEEKGHTFFEDPEMFKLVEEKLNIYGKLSSCDVKLVMPSDPLYKKKMTA
ncbi:hypothetical protein AALP_AA5G241700 [Arabis alpina]|uniref:FBD domain-containing protein n=1 Tax=Arabis alpina TaxID=50452 RepID=A0A087GZ29_ARAAL|nr:hypothetical protein AALP_AA5G241700 [Arabis alpina]